MPESRELKRTAENLKFCFPILFRKTLWNTTTHQISAEQDSVLKKFNDLLKSDEYNRQLAEIVYHENSHLVIPALLKLRNTQIHEYAKDVLLFLCKTIMASRYEYLEYLTFLQVFCESFSSAKLQDSMYDLCFAHYEITRNVLVSIPPSLRFRGEHYNVPEMLQIIEMIIEKRPSCFDSDISEFLISSLHNTIINNSGTSKELKIKVISIFLSLDAFCYKRQDIILCSLLDRFFHIAIQEDLLSIPDYTHYSLAKKSESWIQNSLLSLETYLLLERPTIETLSDITNNDWASVIYLLKIIHSLLENDIAFGDYEKFLSDLLTKISTPMSIPHIFQLDIKMLFCKILSITNWNAYKHFQVRSYFMLLNSFFLFSPYAQLKNQAFKTMMKVLNSFPEMLSRVFFAENLPQFVFDMESCLQYHTSNPLSLQIYTDVSTSLIKSFKFDELLNTILPFDNLKSVLSSVAQISELPAHFKNLCSKSFLKYNKDMDYDVKHAINSLIFKNEKKTYNASRNSVTPRYPGPSQKIVRLYLFLLLRNPSDKTLDENIDICFVDSLRYTDPDIVFAFNIVFESYTIPDKFMIQIIDQLANKNLVLLQIVEQCPSIRLKIASYEHRFKLLEACVTTETEIRHRFVKLFLSIENDEITYEITHDKLDEKKSPYYLLLKSTEFAYILWESYERTSFWKYLTEYAFRHSELTDLLNQIDPFVEHLRGKRYVYIDRKLVLPITMKEFSLENEHFQNCIKAKIRQHNNRMMFKKIIEEGKPSAKKKSKQTKKNLDESEILKIKELQIDSKETRKFIVTVYPNGKKVTDDHEQSVKKELKNLKKLTATERKMLFKTELMSTQATRNYKERVIDISLFIRQRIAIDLFKSTILGYHYVGLLVGLLFNSKIDFATASNQEIKDVIRKYEVTKDDLTLRLFWWFAHYLQLRNCSNKSIEGAFKKATKLLNSTNS